MIEIDKKIENTYNYTNDDNKKEYITEIECFLIELKDHLFDREL
jgi:hypothetical protein